MVKVEFTKMQASGNDFVIIEDQLSAIGQQLSAFAKKICERRTGIGADGMLVLEKSKMADIKMRIFNADGSQAQMCGNGARCTALYTSAKRKAQSAKLKIETKAGIIESQVNANKVKIKLTDPKDIKLAILLKINNRTIKVNFINTGVPHTVIFTEGLDKFDIVPIGRLIRYHKKFLPGGTNVNFVEVLSENSIKVRTYERGVEGETLACGTGSVACGLIFSLKTAVRDRVCVHTKGKEVLTVYFDRYNNKFKNVWLEGRAKIVYKGEYYV